MSEATRRRLENLAVHISIILAIISTGAWVAAWVWVVTNY